jgi:signal transduction histidine kinase
VSTPRGIDVAREARVAGLRRYVTPSLEAVESRRAQLWVVALVVMAGLAFGMLLLSGAEPIGAYGPISRGALRLGLVGLAAGFAFYVVEKEVHLRRLTRLLVDERVLATAFSNRLNELKHLSAAESAVNANLTVESTVDVVLAGAVELLGGISGGVYLKDSGGSLRLARGRGIEGPGAGMPVGPGDGLVAAVAASGEPRLGVDDADGAAGAVTGTVMAAPLEQHGAVLGVILVRRGPSAEFSEYDVRVLSRFAQHSAPAIAHAQLYEGQRQHVAELVERDRLKSSLVAMVSHELKAPLAAIIGAVRTLQRRDLPQEHVDSFLQMIEKQGERLNRLVEDVLQLRKAEGVGKLDLGPVDMVQVARDVVQLSQVAGRHVELRAPAPVLINGDPAALEQIVLNLVDNAFIHGAGVVEIEVEAAEGSVRLSVLDRGPGVSAADARYVFDPFARGTETRVPGSGLGLYLVRSLAEAQGGTVTLSERPGGGADFTVRLPSLGPVAAELAGRVTTE